jgi:acyl-CoA thioester hydrolase
MARLAVPVQLRWGDVDAYQHVNNAAMLQLLEEARIEAFWRHPDDEERRRAGSARAPRRKGSEARSAEYPDDAREDAWPTAVLDGGPGAEMATLVARQEIEYLLPLEYRRTPVIVDLWIARLGGASIDVCYEVRDDGDAPAVYARSTATIVLVEAATGRPRRITDEQRAAWEPYVDEPVVFRRRH